MQQAAVVRASKKRSVQPTGIHRVYSPFSVVAQNCIRLARLPKYHWRLRVLGYIRMMQFTELQQCKILSSTAARFVMKNLVEMRLDTLKI